MRNLSFGFILIIFGVLFLLDNLDVIEFGEVVHYGWPVIFIVWGFMILNRRRVDDVGGIVVTTPPSNTDVLNQSNVFGDLTVNVTNQIFKGGSLSTVFGDCHLDLSKASFAPGEHELHVSTVMGDTIILLPKDGAVTITASSFMGGISVPGQRRDGLSSQLEWATSSYTGASHRLKITISKVFGDATVS